jgi:hypothetical protein
MQPFKAANAPKYSRLTTCTGSAYRPEVLFEIIIGSDVNKNEQQG